MSTYEIKAGATKPAVRVRLRNPGGGIPTLAGSTVKFSLKLEDSAAGVYVFQDHDAVIENAGQAIVAYEWDDGETDTPGDYLGEFKETNVDGVSVWPNRRFVKIRINPRL